MKRSSKERGYPYGKRIPFCAMKHCKSQLLTCSSAKYQSCNTAAYKEHTKHLNSEGSGICTLASQLHAAAGPTRVRTQTCRSRMQFKQQTVIKSVLLACANHGDLHAGRKIYRVFSSIHIHCKCSRPCDAENQNHAIIKNSFSPLILKGFQCCLVKMYLNVETLLILFTQVSVCDRHTQDTSLQPVNTCSTSHLKFTA